MSYFLPRGYVHRDNPSYEHDLQDGGVVYQPDVYADALARLDSAVARRLVIDVGCGRAGKLLAMEGVQTVGIDYGPNVDFLRSAYPDRLWLHVDLEQGIRGLELFIGATVVCADVVEHLRDPGPLLSSLAAMEEYSREVVISTPARDLHYGREHLGPPLNRCHVREWNPCEFQMLLQSHGLHSAVGLTRTSTRGPARQTIEAICRRPSTPL